MNGYVCSIPLYEYEGWMFEYGRMGGPWPVRKDGELFKRAGAKFFDMFQRFINEEDIEKFRIGGGCLELLY